MEERAGEGERVRERKGAPLEEKRVEEHAGEGEGEGEREREREPALAPPFICFFLHLGLPYANWA